MTTVKNKIIKSPKVAVIDVKNTAGEGNDKTGRKPGIISFSLPVTDQQNKDLQHCELGSSESKEDAMLTVGVCICCSMSGRLSFVVLHSF